MSTHRLALRFAATAVVALAATAAACTPGPLGGPKSSAPMNNPVALSSESSSGALESARRELTGTWELVALESAPNGDAARVPVKASGTLVYDEFGNLTIDAHTTDPNLPPSARDVSILTFHGRAVIDVVKKELKLMDMKGNVDPNEVLAPERRRKYEVNDNTLTLSSFNERGEVTAVATWHRRG